jgi:hypothetical protein
MDIQFKYRNIEDWKIAVCVGIKYVLANKS